MKITVLTQHLCTAHGGSHTTLHDTHVPQTDPLQPEPDANAAPCRHGKRLPPGDSRDSDDSCEKKRDLYTDQFHTLHTSQELEIASGTLNKPFVPVRTLTTSTTCLPPRGGTAAKAGEAETHTQTAGRIDARRADAGWKSKTKIQEDRVCARGCRERERRPEQDKSNSNSKSEKSETAVGGEGDGDRQRIRTSRSSTHARYRLW